VSDNSRVFAIRLTLGVSHEQDQARRRFDYVWDNYPKGKKSQWVIACVNDFDFDESFDPEDKIMGLATLSQNLHDLQDGHYRLTQELKERIDSLEAERKAIQGMMRHMTISGQAINPQSISDYVDNSEDVDPDLAESLLGLLDDI
jgi:hypothetical protein